VTLRHEKVHAQDCVECETESGKIDNIEIEAFGDMKEETRAKIAAVADKFPVHKTLHAEVRINSRMKGAAA
jgi:uncharacterized OsmC-like protein